MVGPTIDDVFCLYLWRSLQAPGTLYLARGMASAQAVCAELIALGYIVRVVQTVTNVEYELRNGALVARHGQHELRGMDAEQQPVA